MNPVPAGGRPADGAGTAEAPASTGHVPLARALQVPGVPLVLVAFFAYCAVESTSILWASTYLVRERGVEPARPRRSRRCSSSASPRAGSLTGFVADRLGDRVLIRWGFAAVLAGVALLAVPLESDLLALAGLVLAGLGSAPVYRRSSTPRRELRAAELPGRDRIQMAAALHRCDAGAAGVRSGLHGGGSVGAAAVPRRHRRPGPGGVERLNRLVDRQALGTGRAAADGQVRAGPAARTVNSSTVSEVSTASWRSRGRRRQRHEPRARPDRDHRRQAGLLLAGEVETRHAHGHGAHRQEPEPQQVGPQREQAGVDGDPAVAPPAGQPGCSPDTRRRPPSRLQREEADVTRRWRGWAIRRRTTRTATNRAPTPTSRASSRAAVRDSPTPTSWDTGAGPPHLAVPDAGVCRGDAQRRAPGPPSGTRGAWSDRGNGRRTVTDRPSSVADGPRRRPAYRTSTGVGDERPPQVDDARAATAVGRG